MLDNNKKKLTTLLNFGEKISKQNNDIINDVKIINDMDLDESEVNLLDDLFIKSIEDNTDADNVLFLTNTLEHLNKAVDKSYIENMIIIRTLDHNTDIKPTLNSLLDKQITFNKEENEFTFYKLLVQHTIITQDSDLIKKALDKIQSL